MSATLASELQIIAHTLFGDERIPNNGSLPLLIYKRVFEIEDDRPSKIEKTFAENDWTNSWRDGIYNYHHYHSNTHEVLGIYRGHCIVQFGGDHGVTEEVREGDVVIIPAGVAHKSIGQSEDFKCVGAYPGGKDYNMHYGNEKERAAAEKEIKKVPYPSKDPVFGEAGPLRKFWKQNA